MTVRRVIYKQDAPGRLAPYPGSPYLPFGAFCMSPRMQGLVNKVSRDGAIIARMLSPDGVDKEGGVKYRDSFFVKVGKPLRIDGLLRVTSLIGNSDPKAPAIEFGSGKASVGDSADVERPQGGSNEPFRVLGKVGRILGDFHE